MRALAPEPTSGPITLSQLNEGERFVIRVFRRWVHGAVGDTGLHGRLLWQALCDSLGEADARPALTALSEVIRTVQRYARRRFAYHQPCCSGVTLDEVAVCRLLAACQHRRLELARGHALWLVHADGVGDLLDAACSLAATLRRHGMVLPVWSALGSAGLSRLRPGHPVPV